MKNKDKKQNTERDFDLLDGVSVYTNKGMPETASDMVNFYGTYEIQATAETDNEYPAIAQGYNPKIKIRDGENSHNGRSFSKKDG